jgi:EAL domain-containing protein (putative c-di-GMP-specific phosphodiesterase class I)
MARESDAFLHEMDGQLAGWAEPAERLRQALAKDELALYCQPILELAGPVNFPMAEILVRLREEEKAMLPPGEFLPVFEHYRLMPDLDRWVVRRVLQHLRRGSKIPRFSINVSSQSLEDAAMPKSIGIEVMTSGVPGTSLLFEISEGDLLARLEATVRFATAVRAIGCGIMVDGFGRRAASFAPLKALRPDFVKVDGAIVRNVLAHPQAEAKLRAILRVGEVMGFRAVAEMVEEQDILTRIKALGVGYAQGFGIRQPHAIELVAG